MSDAKEADNAFGFAEIDGLIVRVPPWNQEEWIARMRRDEPGGQSWQQEAFLNHQHTFEWDDAEKAVAKGRQMAADMESALRQAYPERRFTICHDLGDQVTFWQTDEDSPREPEDKQELIFIEPSAPEAREE